jgi:hypothetical protein
MKRNQFWLASSSAVVVRRTGSRHTGGAMRSGLGRVAGAVIRDAGRRITGMGRSQLGHGRGSRGLRHLPFPGTWIYIPHQDHGSRACRNDSGFGLPSPLPNM